MPPRLNRAAAMPRFALMVFAIITVSAVLISTPAKADPVTTTYTNGCYVCKSQMSVFSKTACDFPRQDGWGSDVCTETLYEVVLHLGPQDCSLSGNACMYDCFGPGCDGGGGPGGGGGGGGGGSCAGGGYCDVSCFDCGGSYY